MIDEVLAAAGRAGDERRRTSASSRRSARRRRRSRPAIADALAFHQAIGAERKAARLYYLTMRWANALKPQPRIRMHSSLKPGETWGLATVGIDGMERGEDHVVPLGQVPHHRRRRWRRATLPGQQFDYQGIRVTPNVYTTIGEIDTFARAMQELAKTPPGEVDAAKMRHPRNEP